jgi:shikimate dehydrogenase
MKEYGLIGYPLGHSFSKLYFTNKFEREHITDCVYNTYPIDSIQLLTQLLKDHPNLQGLNVTIPYKETVLPFLTVKSDAVRQIGACNCIKIEGNGLLHGFNTDVIGFEVSLTPFLKPWHTNALILGTGGAAKAVAWVLAKKKIAYTFVSRRSVISSTNISYDQLNLQILKQNKLIINTTPLGMQPNIDSKPSIPYKNLSPEHLLFDLVYNPAKTGFLAEGEKQGSVIMNGQKMLEIQADESWKIWNGIVD